MVTVAPGTYVEQITIRGEHVISEQGAAATILDGGGQGPVVTFEQDGTQANGSLSGFTVTGGDSRGTELGGGIHVAGDMPVITLCRITGNLADRGGGLRIDDADDANVEPVITYCLFDDNHAVGTAGAGDGGTPGVDLEVDGGGAIAVRADTSPFIGDCSFVGNTAAGEGGAILLLDSSVGFGRCLFRGNSAAIGGAISVLALDGLGLAITEAAFEGNHATGQGGAVRFFGFPFQAHDFIIERSRFTGNSAGGRGGAVSAFMDGGGLFTRRSLFARNTAGTRGSALARGCGIHDLDRVTIADNTAGVGGAVDRQLGCGLGPNRLETHSSILWEDVPFSGALPNWVEDSDVKGGWGGPDNIDADPLFQAPDHLGYGLSPDSPCVDAGAGFLDPDGSEPDMGYRQGTNYDELGRPLGAPRGIPRLILSGRLFPGVPMTVDVFEARRGAPALLFGGLAAVESPLQGGTLVPEPTIMIPLFIEPNGTLKLQTPWPDTIPEGVGIFLQMWIDDPAGVDGFSATNAQYIDVFYAEGPGPGG